MITLHQFARVWDIPNLSPFCTKVETYFRMADLAYETADAIPPTAPKRKLPYISDEGRKIADSRFIVDYVAERHRADLDAGLTPAERATSAALQRLIEDDLNSVAMWTRWVQQENWAANREAIFGGLPPVVRGLVARLARRRMRGQVRARGIGEHSADEILAIGKRDVDALSDFLADKPYFLGEAPTTLDASAFGMLSNIVWPPIESPLKTHTQGLENLVAFCQRVLERYYPDAPWQRSTPLPPARP